MFRVVPPPIIRSVNNCIYSIWYLSHRYCYLPLSWKSWNWFECAVDAVVCAPDDGWRYNPKHVEKFPDKINCVSLHLVGYILEWLNLMKHGIQLNNMQISSPVAHETHFISVRKRHLLRVFREIISDILRIAINSSGQNAEHFNVKIGWCK